MYRLMIVTALLVAGLPLIGAGAAVDRHSGSVVSVDQQTQTLVVEELGVAGKRETLAVKVQPGTNVVVSERDPKATDFEHQFTERRIGLGEIKPGDFVVVELSGDGTTPSAESVMVTLRQGS